MKLITHILLCTTILALSSLHQTLGDDDDDDNPSAAASAISPREFTSNACTSASDVDACKKIVNTIIQGSPHDAELDAGSVALETVRMVQSKYTEVAVALKQLVQGDKQDPKLKPALSDCYKMYMDIGHEMRSTTMHLKKKSEICKARDFHSSADANPKNCEEELVKAGTTGEKLGLYKDYNDLQDLAGACDSVIAYMIESDHYKTTDCDKN